MLRLAPQAPFLDVDLLPAVGPRHHPLPRFAHPGNDREDLLKREVAEDEAQGVRDELLPGPDFTALRHVVRAEWITLHPCPKEWVKWRKWAPENRIPEHCPQQANRNLANEIEN